MYTYADCHTQNTHTWAFISSHNAVRALRTHACDGCGQTPLERVAITREADSEYTKEACGGKEGASRCTQTEGCRRLQQSVHTHTHRCRTNTRCHAAYTHTLHTYHEYKVPLSHVGEIDAPWRHQHLLQREREGWREGRGEERGMESHQKSTNASRRLHM